MLIANNGYVIVDADKTPEVSPGGIVLPKNQDKKVNRGVVIDHSYDEYDDSNDLTGCIVYFPEYSGYTIEYENKKYLVIKEENVLAYVSKENDE